MNILTVTKIIIITKKEKGGDNSKGKSKFSKANKKLFREDNMSKAKAIEAFLGQVLANEDLQEFTRIGKKIIESHKELMKGISPRDRALMGLKAMVEQNLISQKAYQELVEKAKRELPGGISQEDLKSVRWQLSGFISFVNAASSILEKRQKQDQNKR